MKKLTRREFVKYTSMAAAGLSLSNPLVEAAARTARQAIQPGVTSANEKVIVCVNLFGGNDGLNTVIPITPARYNEYLQLRPLNGLGFSMSEVLGLNSGPFATPDYALRPGMEAFQSLYASGNLAVINGVGVPDNARHKYDHDAQQNTFQSCDTTFSTSQVPSGWMGRYCDAAPNGQVPPGIDMGGGRLMLTGIAKQPVSIWSIEDFELQITHWSDAERAIRKATYENIMDLPVPEGGAGELNRLYRKNALEQSAIIQAAVQSYPDPPVNNYPDSSFGRRMQEVAKLIHANIGVQCIGLGISGFDTHSGQDEGGNGWHSELMYRVSAGVSALYEDLVRLGHQDRVLIVTISEFGRTPWENNDAGTDHGIASSAFVVGSTTNLTGGIYGHPTNGQLYPSLTDFDGEDGLITLVDFRSIYATIVANFLNADPEPVVDPYNQNTPFPLLTFC
jgi:uncharacterized protein (DUF1501 family)